MDGHGFHTAGRDLQPIVDFLADELAPLVQAIDHDGLYPRGILAGLGRLGGFGGKAPDVAVHPVRQLRVIEATGRHCGASAFLAWCQSACAWYLERAPRADAQQQYLGRVLAGTLLAGTGMSNFLKHRAGIEKIRLHARATGGGCIVDGVLPWVSNLARGHLLLTAAATGNGGYVMLAIDTGARGVELHPCPAFSGMEGTSTFNVRLHEVVVADADVLAYPEQFDAFVAAVKPGLILTQAGLGLGVMAGCIDILAGDAAASSPANEFLDTDADTARAEFTHLRQEALNLAAQVACGDAPLLPVLRLRAAVSEATLRLAQAAVLRVGARGYLRRHPAQRRLREAVFVAIVTPALKHLRKEIHDLAAGKAEAA